MLSKPTIKHHFEMGHIIISPFDELNLGSAQYDVRLGEYFYREALTEPRFAAWGSEPSFYNPYDEKHVQRHWRLCSAVSRGIVERDIISAESLKGIGVDEKVILLHPGEMILAHTEEFIGGSCNFITTQMKARSSIGRNFLTVCACAGQGDVGYHTRWTFEIHNRNRHHTIPLVVGRRIAQILFFEVEPVADADMYGRSGKYQAGSSIEELKATWRPEDMLPRMYRDRETVQAREQEK